MIFSLSQCSIPSLLTTKITPFYEAILTAGAQGIEPWSAVLETAVLPLNDAPMRAPERRLPLNFNFLKDLFQLKVVLTPPLRESLRLSKFKAEYEDCARR